MASEPKVWVLQEGHNDYSPAEAFGEVNFMTKSDLRPMKDSQQNRDVKHDIKRFLADYIVGVDYIVPVGNPMLIVTLAMSLPAGEHRFLKWDGRRATYIPFVAKSVMEN